MSILSRPSLLFLVSRDLACSLRLILGCCGDGVVWELVLGGRGFPHSARDVMGSWILLDFQCWWFVIRRWLERSSHAGFSGSSGKLRVYIRAARPATLSCLRLIFYRSSPSSAIPRAILSFYPLPLLFAFLPHYPPHRTVSRFSHFRTPSAVSVDRNPHYPKGPVPIRNRPFLSG